jgi:hypothetical protein
MKTTVTIDYDMDRIDLYIDDDPDPLSFQFDVRTISKVRMLLVELLNQLHVAGSTLKVRHDGIERILEEW